MAKQNMSDEMIRVLRNLKAQLDASIKNPAQKADGTYDLSGYSPFIKLGGTALAPTNTVHALARRGCADIITDRWGFECAQITATGLSTLSQ